MDGGRDVPAFRRISGEVGSLILRLSYYASDRVLVP